MVWAISLMAKQTMMVTPTKLADVSIHGSIAAM